MKKISLAVSFLLLFSIFSFAQESADYRQALQKMFEVSGSVESYKPAVKQMLAIYKQQYPSVSQEKWESMESDLVDLSLNDLVDLLVPVYQKYLSISDLEDVIRFYQSPVGVKFAEATPKLTQEAMMLGQQLAGLVNQRVKQKMEEEGIE